MKSKFLSILCAAALAFTLLQPAHASPQGLDNTTMLYVQAQYQNGAFTVHSTNPAVTGANLTHNALGSWTLNLSGIVTNYVYTAFANYVEDENFSTAGMGTVHLVPNGKSLNIYMLEDGEYTDGEVVEMLILFN